MDKNVQATIDLWAEKCTIADLKEELDALIAAGDEEKLFDAFYRSLEFGTAGLRGTLGVGTNRMNEYVVGQATQGVADYLNAHYENPTLALARDSRLKGEEFQKYAAGILAANGVKVYLFPRIEPVPTLSFAVRHLGTSAGIVLTASHNPAAYNGYKVYNDNGGQITDEAAAEISANIAAADCFALNVMDFDEGLANGMINWIGDDVIDAFIAAVKKVSVPGFKADESYSVVYTPLNGRRQGVRGSRAGQPRRPLPDLHLSQPRVPRRSRARPQARRGGQAQPGRGHRPRRRPHGHRHPA